MRIKKKLSLIERENRLLKVIKDLEEMGIHNPVLLNYKQQLEQVRGEIKEDKKRDVRIRKIERGFN